MDLLTGERINRRAALGAVLALTAGGPAASQTAFTGPGTTIVEPDQVRWITPPGAPPKSYEAALLVGDPDKPGPYVALLRWHPGYISAPHTYLTDRTAFVLSGTGWVDSAPDYRPDRCQPISAGAFIQRAARANKPSDHRFF